MAYRFRGRWRAEVRHMGKVYRKVFSSYREAIAYEHAVKSGQAQDDETTIKRASLRFRDLCEEWYESHCRVKKAPSQWYEDRKAIDFHLLPAFGDKLLALLSVRDLEKIQQTLSKSLKPKTVNNITDLATAIMKKAVDWDYVSKNPFEGVSRLPIVEQSFDFWTVREREQFLAFAKEVDEPFFDLVSFAAHTGLRLGEIRGLKWDAIDLVARRITVKRSYCSKTKKVLESTKSKKIGYVPMNETVVAILRSKRNEGPDKHVFKEAMLYNPSTKLRRMAKRANVKPIRFHDLRHTYASSLVMAGVDIFTVQRLMRHGSVQMTQRYSHLSPSHLSEKVEAIVAHGVAHNVVYISKWLKSNVK